ncbi:hypothetical protein MLD38_012677 [Melastoma candidum]|uniref:Uncharacterized protein n=1 Tax=Melastoma candidum TaxID=119954 RepID=A0ACB9R778_9MYRT|nr:hypothetical protein MLD38_012677 [Melastoma candidum]
MNEPQWVGIIVRPLNYSLKDALLHIDTGPGLTIVESHTIEIESIDGISESSSDCKAGDDTGQNDGSDDCKNVEQLLLEVGKMQLPDWVSNVMSTLWIPVQANSDELAKGTSSGNPQKQRIVDRMRTIALNLQFGVSHNQVFDRTIAVYFTYPFHVSTRLQDKCSDGTLLLQVTLQSQVNATLTVYDAWMDLQDGFVHV